MWGREESRLNTPRTGVPREERETTPQKPVEDVKLQEAPRARSRWMGRSHGPPPPAGSLQDAGQRGGCKQRRREGRCWGRRRGPLTCFLSPPPRAGSSRGAGGAPAGGQPTSPEQACTPLGGGLGGLFPNTGVSLPPSLLLLVPHPHPPPPKAVLLVLPSGVRSWCMQQLDHKAKLL